MENTTEFIAPTTWEAPQLLVIEFDETEAGPTANNTEASNYFIGS
jgi:hypothetical protein